SGRGDDELSLAADCLPDAPLVLPADHLPLAEGEGERLPPLSRAVELFSVEERPHVMDADGVARLRRGPLADEDVGGRQLCVWVGRGGARRRGRLLGRRGGGRRRVGGDRGDRLGGGGEAVAGGDEYRESGENE